MQTLVKDNIDCLKQGIRLLNKVEGSLYRHLSPQCFESTVGGHIRHNIDHYLSFLNGYVQGRIDYDDRKRDARIEEEPEYASQKMQEIIDGLGQIGDLDLDSPVEVKMDCGCVEESAPWSHSTFRRELQFLLSHTIHHYALIAVICTLQGVKPDPEFGVAPSTLKYKQSNMVLG